MDNFKKKVLDLIKSVPRGKVTTYNEVARALESPGAARAVGQALNKNERPVKIPCHRVVKSDGRVGGYKLGRLAKMKLLQDEGVIIERERVANFNEVIYFF